MALRDEVAADTKAAGRPCRIVTVFGAMPKKLGEEFLEILDDPTIQHAALSRTLTRLGHPLSAEAIMKHRSGACRCAKS